MVSISKVLRGQNKARSVAEERKKKRLKIQDSSLNCLCKYILQDPHTCQWLFKLFDKESLFYKEPEITQHCFG